MPMKVTTHILGGRMIVEFPAESVKELFEKSGSLFEALGGDSQCGKCESKHIFPRVRMAGKYSYYELVCGDCGAKLSFGQSKDLVTIWPKRVAENGNPLPNRGWAIYAALAAPKDEVPEEGAPPMRTAPAQRPADPPELVKLLSDPTAFEQVKRDLFFAIVDAYGEKNANDPKSRAAWNQVNAGGPNEKDLIRRLFHFKIGDK